MRRVFRVSCATGAGIDELRRALFELCPPEPPALAVEEGAEELAEFLVYRPEPTARAYRILRTDRGFRVTGTPPAADELERALRAAGARRGSRSRSGTRRVRVIGLFGGAFNPPHNGHLELARRALEEFGLDRLDVLVSGDPAHKDVECPVDVRVALAEQAFAGLPRASSADPYRYTIDRLRAEPPPDDAVFLMGADQYRDFATWKEPDEVLGACGSASRRARGSTGRRSLPGTRGASGSSRSTRRRSRRATSGSGPARRVARRPRSARRRGRDRAPRALSRALATLRRRSSET